MNSKKRKKLTKQQLKKLKEKREATKLERFYLLFNNELGSYEIGMAREALSRAEKRRPTYIA